MNFIIFSGILAFIISVFSMSLLGPLAIRLGLVDEPGGRKQHTGRIPLIGGVGIFIGFCFALLTLPISLFPFRSFLAGSLLLVIVGVLDDFHELSPKSRLIAQIIAGMLMVIWGANYLENIEDIFFLGPVYLGLWGIPFTIFAAVATINAVNMTDGVDGLAGGVSLVELIIIAIFTYLAGEHHLFYITSLMIASLLGFLCFNFPYHNRRKAEVFLGDAGSMFLGFALTWLVVELSQYPHKVIDPVIILWILSVHVFDIVTVTFKRIFRGDSPFKPSEDHMHHIIKRAGYSSLQCTLVLCCVSIIMGIIAIISKIIHIPDGVMFLGFIAIYLVYLSVYNSLTNRINRYNLASDNG